MVRFDRNSPHVKDAAEAPSLDQYRGLHKYPMTNKSMAHWVSRFIFGRLEENPVPEVVCPNPEKIGLPWDRKR